MKRVCGRCSRAMDSSNDPLCNRCAIVVDQLTEDGFYCKFCMGDVRQCGHWTADHNIPEEEADRGCPIHPGVEHWSNPDYMGY